MSDKIIKEGEVVEALRDAYFRVEMEDFDVDGGHELMCHISGSIRQNNIEITPGDLVEVEISPYDLEKGRIVRRVDDRE